MELFTSLNPAEAAIIATAFAALLILCIVLSVRTYFHQTRYTEQEGQLTELYKTHKELIDTNFRLKTEIESLWAKIESKEKVSVESERIHRQAVDNAAKYARCLEFIKVQKKAILLENGESMPNPVLYWLEKIEEQAERLDKALKIIKEEQLEGNKFYLICKHFVNQNNLVENSAQRNDNVVIEALQTLAGQVINYDKEIGRIRAEFEKYGAKFKTRTNTAGQVAEKLATMHRKTTDLVMAASRIPRVGQVPRESFANLMKCAADAATVKMVNPEVR